MGKADKRRIEELEDMNKRYSEQTIHFRDAYLRLSEEADELRQKLKEEQEKYVCLLERYIVTMERTVGLNEQREAD
jgi:molecular chaperone GrpE (heat shock protein)